jgi:hypothetical protein
MISEKLIGKDVEGSCRGSVQPTIPEFAWRDWEKPRETPVRVAGLQAEIWTWGPQNMKQDHDVRCYL